MDVREIFALIEGAVDMHVHSAPDLIERKFDDLEAAKTMREACFSGFVIKNHFEETAARASIATRACGGISVYGGITLNYSVGGINPSAVEASLGLGGRIVWMPTVDSANQKTKSGKSGGIKILNEKGRLVAPVYDILDLVKDSNAVIATGHLGLEEVFRLVEAAAGRGIEKIVVTHPDFWITSIPPGAQRELAGHGVFFEWCFYSSTLVGDHATPFEQKTVHWIRRLGHERSVVASDMGQKGNPTPPEAFVTMIGAFGKLGFTNTQIETMIKKNPRALLDP